MVELATRIAQGELRNALAVTRPPGHHCERGQAMGFCLLNNVPVAIAALREREGIKKALVLDWDVRTPPARPPLMRRLAALPQRALPDG